MSDVSTIVVSNCPTCGALAQCIDGEPPTFRHVPTGDEALRVAAQEFHEQLRMELELHGALSNERNSVVKAWRKFGDALRVSPKEEPHG